MDWKTGNDLKIFSCYPYRIENVRGKYKLYRYTRDPIDGRWTMCLLGKFESLEDAALAAENDKMQGRLFE